MRWTAGLQYWTVWMEYVEGGAVLRLPGSRSAIRDPVALWGRSRAAGLGDDCMDEVQNVSDDTKYW